MTDAELGRLLLGLVCLFAAALVCGRLFERLGMPQVIGEIVGGLLLGPSALAIVAPEAYRWLFDAFPAQGALFSAFYWIGLILLMFVAGFRVERKFSRDDQFTIAIMLASSTVLPMAGGYWLTLVLDTQRLMHPGANPLSFHLVLAIATAVTSIPVISRIFLDLGLMQTRFAKIVLTTATLQDLLLWTVLAVSTGLNVSRAAAPTQIGWVVAMTLAFVVLSVALGPALLVWIGRTLPLRRDTSALVGYALAVCFALAAAASIMEINIVFGALMAGLIVGSLPGARVGEVKQRIADVALWFFVPIYFAIVGLKINLPMQFDLATTVIFIVASSLLKFVSVAIVLKLVGKPLHIAIDYGISMNTRGGPGIVLASIALAFNIITETFFVTLVLASIVTSLITGLWLRAALQRGHDFSS